MNKTMKKNGAARRRLRCGTMLATSAAVLAVSLSMVANAQEEEEDDDAVTETITVTGSRLTSQFESDSPIDIISVDEAAIEGLSDIASLLRTQTVAAGSPQITAATSSIFVQDGGVGTETLSLRGLGANRTLTLLNGRRAGPAGTRGAVSAFDLNVLPLSAVERVEILKDGASSIHGSDAVAGVVNLITRQGDGGTVNAFFSQPEESGGEEFSIDGSWGKEFGRGWIRGTASYHEQTTLLNGERDYFACGQDYIYDDDWNRVDIIDPRTGQPRCVDLPWGHVWTYDYTTPTLFPDRPWQARPALVQYDYDGALAQYLPNPATNPMGGGLVLPPGWFPVGYGELLLDSTAPDAVYDQYAALSEGLVNQDHPYQNETSLIPDVERMTVFVNGEFEITDGLTLYSEVLLNRRKTDVNSYKQFWTYQYVYDYAPGLTLGDPLAIQEGWFGTLIGLSPTVPTTHNDQRITVDYGRFVTGLTGDYGQRLSSWSWDVYGQFSRSEGEYDIDIVFDDAITPYEFRGDFCANTADALTPIRGIPCVDINWYTPEFNNGEFTPEEEAFLLGNSIGETIYEQWNIDGTTAGELFQLPAGAVSAAVGFQYREDSINDVPGEPVLQKNVWNQSVAGITEGEQSTKAFFGEIGIPLLSGLPFIESLDVTASARYTDIESNGPVADVNSPDPTDPDFIDTTVTDESTTYKVGAGWQLTPEWKVRSTYGTSFRSPALFELFLGNQTSFLGQRVVDPCVNWASNLANGGINQRVADNCAADGIPAAYNGSGASVTIFSRGGAASGLQSETSDATTFGVVWTPSFADLQVAIDWFDINIEDEVTQLGAANILVGCYDSLDFGNEPLCDLFVRNPPPSAPGDPPAFLIDTVQDDFVNIATQKNTGIDLEVLYRTDIPWGMLTVGTQVSLQLEDEVQLLPGSLPDNLNGEAGDPEIVGDVDFTYETGPWSMFYGVRYVGRTSNIDSFGDQTQRYFGQDVQYRLWTEPTIYHSASIARELPHGVQLRLGVSNIFDEHPPSVTDASSEFDTVGTSAFYSQYDWLGRRAFVNVSVDF